VTDCHRSPARLYHCLTLVHCWSFPLQIGLAVWVRTDRVFSISPFYSFYHLPAKKQEQIPAYDDARLSEISSAFTIPRLDGAGFPYRPLHLMMSLCECWVIQQKNCGARFGLCHPDDRLTSMAKLSNYSQQNCHLSTRCVVQKMP